MDHTSQGGLLLCACVGLHCSTVTCASCMVDIEILPCHALALVTAMMPCQLCTALECCDAV